MIIKPCHTISVVVPVLNEEGNIAHCVSGLKASPHVCEVIVVDGGSEDGTAEEAQKSGAVVLVHNRPYFSGGGRGGQIRAGLSISSGDIVAVVHADTTVPPEYFRRMVLKLNSDPSLIGGAVGCRFLKRGGGHGVERRKIEAESSSGKDAVSLSGEEIESLSGEDVKSSSGEEIVRSTGEMDSEEKDRGKMDTNNPYPGLSLKAKLRIVEMLNISRSLLLNIHFGDQVQFFRREPVIEKDLFPDMPLMEDVELSLRLNSSGRQTFLMGGAMASTRRWKRLGLRNGLSIIMLFTEYLVRRLFLTGLTGRSAVPDTASFYRRYYMK